MARRVPIVAKLLGAYLVPTVATFAGFGVLTHLLAQRSLEEELGRRLTAVAAAAASQIADENVALLQEGDESTRTYGNVKRRLDELARASGVAGMYVFDPAGHTRCDARGALPIGTPLYRLTADRTELARVFAGTAQSSVLFRGRDGALYKSGYAPIYRKDGSVHFALGVDGGAALYQQLATFRRTVVVVGILGALSVVGLSLLMARLLVRPLRRLAEDAARMGAGDLDQPVVAGSRDEVGVVAETLETLRNQLRSRDERTQMMLAGIAHEVRNPLGGMELYAGLLRDELGGDPAKLELLKRIERELGHLKTVVGGFLEYARRPKPELQPRDVAELLAQVRDLALAQAQPRSVEITLETVRARVACDEGQLRRALLNLAQNAVQACPADGTGRVRLSCARENGEVIVTVADSGAGIDRAALEKIWTPFYTTKQSGTGLGLAFVREIVREHSARIDVDSQPGRGTTFTLALKAEKEQA